MKLEVLKQKKIAILGLRVEGMATLQFLLKHGIKPVVLDEQLREDEENIKALRALDVHYFLGQNVFTRIIDFDIVFRSPGISLARSELQHAREKGVVISSHIKLFFDLCPAPIIGVTGSKGKGTTATLIYEMLKEQGFDAYLGGNIGKPPLDFLDNLNDQSKVVLELSSFQLEDIEISPHIAVMLMVIPEHLGADIVGTKNYHETLQEYIDAKRNILKFQLPTDYAVINRDYIASNESDIHTDGKVFYVSRERETENGCFALRDGVIIRRNGQNEEIIKTSEVALLGRHNLENVCAATMAAKLAGVTIKNIITVLKTFTGLEHRLQLIREVNGVKYYDDSFSTTPETAIAAIESFKQPEILILGGSSKQSDFSELGKVIRFAKNVKAIIGIGIEWEVIKEHIGTANHDMLLIENAENMQQIVLAASKLAVPGDVVLLSPACASFDMFKSYKERGEQFQKEVQEL